MELPIATDNLPLMFAAAAIPTLLIILMCACSDGDDKSEFMNTNRRNAKLAALLAMMLVAEPNPKYLEIAKDIGIDHIVPDERVFGELVNNSDTGYISDSDSDE